jgi:hypothetical protein
LKVATLAEAKSLSNTHFVEGQKPYAIFITVHTYLINIFLKIVKSQCSPFSTVKKEKKRK